MSFEIESLDTDDYLDYANWMQTVGLWDGRPVTLEEAPAFQKVLEERLTNLIYSLNPNSSEFEQFGAMLATLGTAPENRALLARDIQHLYPSPNGTIVLTGLRKEISKLWKNHKTEILIGAGIVAVVGVIVVVTVCSGGTATGLATSAVEGACAATMDYNSDVPTPQIPSQPIPTTVTSIAISDPSPIFNTPNPYAEIPSLPEQTIQPNVYQNFFNSQSPLVNPFNSSTPVPSIGNKPLINYTPVPFPSVEQDWTKKDFLTSIGQTIMEPNAFTYKSNEWFNDSSTPATAPKSSSNACRIGGINGMATSFEQAQGHAAYINQFMPENTIEWVYNQTNGAHKDLFTIFHENYPGFSGKNAQMLQENWTKFHEDNKDNPDAKYLQFCHSQGAIHVKNGLASTPKEIRDRIIVVAIAPAAIISRESCFQSFNYASSRDLVPLGELYYIATLDPENPEKFIMLDHAQEVRKQLIILEPHSEAKWMDHNLQSPTYIAKIKQHIELYLSAEGVYK